MSQSKSNLGLAVEVLNKEQQKKKADERQKEVNKAIVAASGPEITEQSRQQLNIPSLTTGPQKTKENAVKSLLNQLKNKTAIKD